MQIGNEAEKSCLLGNLKIWRSGVETTEFSQSARRRNVIDFSLPLQGVNAFALPFRGRCPRLLWGCAFSAQIRRFSG